MAKLPVFLVLLSLGALLPATARAESDQGLSRWAGRLQVNSTDARSDHSMRLGSSRILSANLLGDYYLTSSGSADLRGGLRATGGVLMGPLSLSQSSSGLALGSGPFSAGRRHFTLTGPTDALDTNTSLSYFGIGYTAHLKRSGFAFSADLGLLNGSVGGPRLGRTSAQGFEDAMRDLRFKPLLQLGLDYSY